MARELYNGRLPHEAVTAEAVCFRLDKVLDAMMPGYTEAFVGQHCGTQLLSRHGHLVDEALFAAVWRYTSVVGQASFPCGVSSWPWSCEQRNEFTATLPAEGASVVRCSEKGSDVAVAVKPKKSDAAVAAATATGASGEGSAVKKHLGMAKAEKIVIVAAAAFKPGKGVSVTAKGLKGAGESKVDLLKKKRGTLVCGNETFRWEGGCSDSECFEHLES